MVPLEIKGQQVLKDLGVKKEPPVYMGSVEIQVLRELKESWVKRDIVERKATAEDQEDPGQRE